MKTKTVLSLLCVVGVGCRLLSCSPIQSYSEIPEIHFKKLVFADSIDSPDLGNLTKYAVLNFSFVDGDGDLGVRPQEKTPDGGYYPGGGISRIHYTWYQKNPDKIYPFADGNTTISSEIPYSSVMDKSEAQNKTLKGTIEIRLYTPKDTQGIDSMRIEFYIVDRAGNTSNIEQTPDFSILSESGTEITK